MAEDNVKLPPSVAIEDTVVFWLALQQVAPSIFSFVLSYIVILIT